MLYRKSESLDFPVELDTSTSETTVFVRKNIMVEERTNNDGKTTVYVFDEYQYSKLEFMDLNLSKNQADIDYISCMTGVDLNV